MRVFVDTSAFYALLDRDDLFHEPARAAWAERIDRGDPMVTSNYVLVETVALAQRRLGMEAVRGFTDALLAVVTTEWIGEDDHRRALDAVRAAGRRDLSLVDCSSFRVMRRANIRTVFTFDRHFAEQGFDVVPATEARDAG